MPKHAYALYVSTFDETTAALRAGDEQRLRAICSVVAGRGGIESTVSLMAISDAERGASLRSKTQVRCIFWRNEGVARLQHDHAAGSDTTPAPRAA